MAFNPAPSGYFPNINVGEVVSGTTGVFIPWSDLESYDSSTSGDIRQLVYGFNQAIYETYVALPVSGRPTQMSISRGQIFPSDNVVRRTFTTVINTSFSGDLVVVYESGV